MTSGLLIHADGTLIDVQVTAGSVAGHLGCRVGSPVALTSRLDMWIDDESIYAHPVNPIATALARRHGLVWQPYHGPALLCGVDAEGGSCNLTNDQLIALLTALEEI